MSERAPYILLVEDEPSVALMVAERLADLGYEIKSAASAAQARTAIIERVPLLMVLDYVLPGETGLAFIESLKARGEACPPFIVMTGHSGEEVAIAMLRAGARNFVVKAGSFLDPLHSAVKSVLAELESARQLKAVHLALKESEEEHRELFEQARDSIILLEPTPDGDAVIRDINAATRRVHGYTREELLGRSISILIPETLPKSLVKKHVSAALSNKTAIFESQHRRKDGSVFDIETSTAKMEIGGKTLILAITRDITERKQAAETLRETRSATAGCSRRRRTGYSCSTSKRA